MVTDQVKKRLAPGEVPGAPDSMAVSARFRLVHEGTRPGVTGHRTVRIFVLRMNDDARVVDARSTTSSMITLRTDFC